MSSGTSSQSILQVVEQELASIIAVVTKWNNREKDRGQERPRWVAEPGAEASRPDQEDSSLHQYQDPRAERPPHRHQDPGGSPGGDTEADTRGGSACEGPRMSAGSPTSHVVFLPLGFASSIFSMTETPQQFMLGRMATTAVVALFVTVILLLCAKSFFSAIHKYSLEAMKQRSALHRPPPRKRRSADRRG